MTVHAKTAGLAGIIFLTIPACTEGKKPDTSATSSAAVTASAPSPSASSSATEVRGADEIRPVYPVDAGPPDPLAQRYCDAIYEEPVRRMTACCGPVHGAAVEMGGQCVRVLTAALSTKAVTLDPADIDRCADAMKQATAGCDWVTPYASIAVPPACDGVIKGALQAKARCRSSLECGGNLRCQGLSTVDTGTCDAPKPAGQSCNLAVDMLATLTRQDHYGRAHPECDGYCAGRRCEAARAEGAACKADVQCGVKARCAEGKCASTPPPKAGEPCGTSECAYGLRCAQGKCVAPKAEGEACASDAECRGACNKGDAGAGKCDKQCTISIPSIPQPPPVPPPPRKR